MDWRRSHDAPSPTFEAIKLLSPSSPIRNATSTSDSRRSSSRSARTMFEIDIRIFGHEIRNNRDQMHTPEHDRSRHGQAALGIFMNAHRSAFRVFDLFENTSARLDIQPSRFRQPEMPTRTVQHARLQMRFEFRYASTDCSQRNAESLGRLLKDCQPRQPSVKMAIASSLSIIASSQNEQSSFSGSRRSRDRCNDIRLSPGETASCSSGAILRRRTGGRVT